MVTIFTLISFVCIVIMLFAFIQARMKLLALFCLPLLAFSVGVLIDLKEGTVFYSLLLPAIIYLMNFFVFRRFIFCRWYKK